MLRFLSRLIWCCGDGISGRWREDSQGDENTLKISRHPRKDLHLHSLWNSGYKDAALYKKLIKFMVLCVKISSEKTHLLCDSPVLSDQELSLGHSVPCCLPTAPGDLFFLPRWGSMRTSTPLEQGCPIQTWARASGQRSPGVPGHGLHCPLL